MKKDSSNSNNKSVRGILILIIVVCTSIIGYIYKDNILSYLADTIKIDNGNEKKEVTSNDEKDNSKTSCKDISSKADCLSWKQFGHCEKSPSYMIQYCALTCEVCDLVNPEVRCKQFYSNPRVFKNDEMDNMFNDLVHSYSQSCNNKNDDETCNNVNNTSGLTVISRDPWVVTIDNFITSEEADTIISIPLPSAWIQSTAAGAYQADGLIKREISEIRTSKNAWCQAGCDDHPTVQSVMSRMSNTIKVPISNFEHMQILKYDPGQFYRGHHDYIHSPPAIEEAIGPRIITFFLYLSNVTSGGETYFNTLNITVAPSKGKALIWANTISKDPNVKDIRTFHEAKDVIEGIKYGANIWIHQKDFRSANHWACSG